MGKIESSEPFALVGGWMCTDLVDCTTDLAALDGEGFWAVLMPYDGAPVCARFAAKQPIRARFARTWGGLGPTPLWSSSLDQAGFMSGVRAIKERIGAGDVYQVNLTRRLETRLVAPIDMLGLAAVLDRGNPAPYAATLSVPDLGIAVVSASPERFLTRHGRTVTSSPIKGTAVDADGFLDKDYAENVMIVDLVRNDLGRVCEPGTIDVPGLYEVENHPGLVHLVSTVRGELRAGLGWPELLDATFPPGSVTGAPKLAALQVISALEPTSRGPYCGGLGWVDADRGTGDLGVTIRTFWVDEDRLCFGTGGGITAGSDPAGEWAETELKAANLLRVVGMPDNGSGR